MLSNFLGLMWEFSGACSHQHVGWPQCSRQRCLDRGAWRSYDLQNSMQGEWSAPERPQSALKVADLRADVAWSSWTERIEAAAMKKEDIYA